MLAHPDLVAGFIANHFFNNEITSLLLLPVRSGLDDPFELVFPTRPFWMEWSGHLSPGKGLLVGFNLAMIGLGIAACWRRGRWTGWFRWPCTWVTTSAMRRHAFQARAMYCRPAGWSISISAPDPAGGSAGLTNCRTDRYRTGRKDAG